MSEDRGSDATDPTLTPSQAFGVAATSASLTPAPRAAATGALPARYTLGARIGAGGMGEVLVATDQQIDREVAIKRMRIEPNADAIARFVREAKIQGRLDHPAIVPVHELSTDADGRPFFVMKRLSGTTLAEQISNRGPLQKHLRAFADVCLAIEFAHSRGIIHRDLKPANIMLGDYGEVYVLDWGVARMLDERDDTAATVSAIDAPIAGETQAGAILGTPGYIAPELLRGEPIDTRADVYALGCILFEILAGEPLLPRGRAALDAALATVDARASQRAVGIAIPPELDALCVAATDADRAKRPTARELATAIEQYLDGDRDLALRKSVAATHAAAAQAAFAAGDSELQRATAMREAGRAIAIDPKNREGADLVARLMLEPPREVPREVELRVAAIEEATAREKLVMLVPVELSFLLFIPLVVIMGLRSGLALAVFTCAVVLNIAHTVWTAWTRPAPSVRDLYAAAFVFGLLLSVMSRLFSPFFLAPGIGAVSLLMFAIDPRARWVPLAVGFIVAVLVPWGLEVVGVLTRTTLSVNGELVLHSDLVSIVMPQAELVLALFVITIIGLAGYMASRLAKANRRAVQTLELQAWHLRQLVS